MNLRDNKFCVFIIILLLLLNYSNTQALDWEEDLHNPVSEFLVATTGDFLIGTLIVIGSVHTAYDLEDVGKGVLIGYIVGGSVGAPTGTIITGNSLEDEGSYLGSYAGGIIGTGLGFLSIYLYNRIYPNDAAWPAIIPALLLPPVFSVIGYNLHKSENEFNSSIPNNFPKIGLMVLPEKHGDKILPKIGANVMFRF
jgi:hypothetical protein